MAELLWDVGADAAMAQLERARNVVLLQRVNEALDRLEADPTDERVRRRRYSNGLWGVPVTDGTLDWLLLWEESPSGRAEVLVQYLGPDV